MKYYSYKDSQYTSGYQDVIIHITEILLESYFSQKKQPNLLQILHQKVRALKVRGHIKQETMLFGMVLYLQ